MTLSNCSAAGTEPKLIVVFWNDAGKRLYVSKLRASLLDSSAKESWVGSEDYSKSLKLSSVQAEVCLNDLKARNIDCDLIIVTW